MRVTPHDPRVLPIGLGRAVVKSGGRVNSIFLRTGEAIEEAPAFGYDTLHLSRKLWRSERWA